MILGLNYIIWVVLVVYFTGMLLLGWWSKRSVRDREGYLLGGRKFGVAMMTMHAFGAGTNPTDTSGVISKSAGHRAISRKLDPPPTRGVSCRRVEDGHGLLQNPFVVAFLYSQFDLPQKGHKL